MDKQETTTPPPVGAGAGWAKATSDIDELRAAAESIASQGQTAELSELGRLVGSGTHFRTLDSIESLRNVFLSSGDARLERMYWAFLEEAPGAARIGFILERLSAREARALSANSFVRAERFLELADLETLGRLD